MPWLSQRDLEVEAPVRLFCLPHAGSGAAGFYRWKRLLSPDIAVCPILLPGREGRFVEPALRSAAGIVAAILPELQAVSGKPFAIYGHSMGSLLAYELAGALPRSGSGAPRALIVSGRSAPGFELARGPLHRLTDQALVGAIRERYGEHGGTLLDDPELRALFLPVLRADLEVVETYAPSRGVPLTCPIAAFAGADDRSVSGGGLSGWQECTTGAFTAQRLPGDHFFHFGEGQTTLLEALRAVLLLV